MEHLPWPETLSRDRPSTPYLCAGLEDNICNDIDEFLHWPETCGWTLDADLPTLESARQCQSWLFFGSIRILTQETGREFDICDYIDRSCPNKLDSTSLQSLPYSTTYTLQVFSTTLSEYSSWFRQVVNNLEVESCSCNPWEQMLFNVFWSTVILFELMVERHTMDYIERSFPSLYGSQSLAEALRMLGRCPNVLQRTHLSPLNAYRLLSIPLRTHTLHSECQLRQCQNINISEATYNMQHAAWCSDHADCHAMGILRQSLKHLIETQRTPVVRSHLTRQGCLTIEIVDGTDVDSVTAISHVWAGGLGNFKDNSHYHCQLLELHKDLDASTARRGRDSTVYYWLDTLCIPTNDSSLKGRAINTMAAVYAGCSSVLVIDPELTKLDRKKLEPQQVDVALFCSPWMARSWTLQEGALAVDLRLKFADSIYHFPPFDRSMHLSTSTMIRSLWTRDVDRLAPPESFRVFSGYFSHENDFRGDDLAVQRMKQDPKLRLANVWNELCGRSSTKVDDIAAILAVFLNRSPGEVLDIQEDRQMLALLRTQTTLPVSLLFARTHRTSSFWNPCFPTSSLSHNVLTGVMGFMEFLPSGLLKLEDTRYMHIWKVLGEIPTSGIVKCQDPTTMLCIEVRFVEENSKKKAIHHVNVIFALSMFYADDLGQGTGNALCFIATKDDPEGLHARFVAPCVWQGRIDNSIMTTDVDADVDSTCLATSATSTSARVEYFTVTGPIDGSRFSNDFPLVLDMGKHILFSDRKQTLMQVQELARGHSLLGLDHNSFPSVTLC